MEGGKLTLYWNVMSGPSRAVKTVLDMGKVPHEEKLLDLQKGE